MKISNRRSGQLRETARGINQFELLTLGGFAYVRCTECTKYWKAHNKDLVSEIVDNCMQHIMEDHEEGY